LSESLIERFDCLFVNVITLIQIPQYKDFLQLLIDATLTYIAYLLALHPEIQQKLRREIEDYYNQNPVILELF